MCHFTLSTVALFTPPTPLGTPSATTRNVATQILQGTGPPKVDLDQYNLPIDEIEKEWKVLLVQKSAEKQSRVVLAARSTQNYADTVTVTFPRIAGQGLGLGLAELAGGREDGLGITVVSEVLTGGAAEKASSPILTGDSISQLRLVRRQNEPIEGSFSQDIQEFPINTECLSYDSTVAAIASLPFADPKWDDSYVVTLKRLRRKPKVTVNLLYPPGQKEEDVSIELFAGENLRMGMLVRGIKLNDPLAKRFDTKNGGNCGAGGLCRTCSVVVQSGMDLLNPQRVSERQMLADTPRWRLACKAIVGYGLQEGNLTIRVNPNQW